MPSRTRTSPFRNTSSCRCRSLRCCSWCRPSCRSPFETKEIRSAARSAARSGLAEASLIASVCAPEGQRAPRVRSSVRGPGDVSASSGLLTLRSLLYCPASLAARAGVLAFRFRLDLTPQADRPPPLFGDATDQLVDERELGLDQSKAVLALDQE